METSVLNEQLIDRVIQLDPSGNINRAVASLLLMKNRRDLVKYELMCKNFQQKYRTNFSIFKEEISQKAETDYQKEQDFFDWDMAITTIDELKEEINYLQRFVEI